MILLRSILITLQGLLRVPTYILLSAYLLVDILIVLALAPHQSVSTVIFAVRFALSMFVIATWYINATALNDYADYEIDKINLKSDPDRPLVQGQSSHRQLKYIAVFAALATAIAAYFIGVFGFVVTLIMLCLNMAYSVTPMQISRRGGLAPALLPLAYIGLPLSLSISILGSQYSPKLVVMFIALYLIFESRILLKDYRDVVGDAKYGKRTFLLNRGNLATSVTSAICLIIGIVFLVSALGFSRRAEIFALVLLSAYALGYLLQLSQANTWLSQRGQITSYGRSQTGILALIGLSFYRIAFGMSPKSEVLSIVLIVSVTFLSVMKIQRLQSPQ